MQLPEQYMYNIMGQITTRNNINIYTNARINIQSVSRASLYRKDIVQIIWMAPSDLHENQLLISAKYS